VQCQHIKVGVVGHNILKGEKIAFFKIINSKKVTENDQRNNIVKVQKLLYMTYFMKKKR